MKILLTSLLFPPSIGGIETVSLLLAREFAEAGHDVRVATQTPGKNHPDWPFEVIRRPSMGTLSSMTRWSDLCFQSNISLPLALPLAWIRRPWVIVHHTWIPHPRGPRDYNHWLKRFLLRHGHSIAISRAIAEDLPVESVLIPNPYDRCNFRRMDGISRDGDLIAVGRLVSDKGFDVLIDALSQLAERGLRPRLSLVGDGPEEPVLREQAKALGVASQVAFHGAKTGDELAALLNAHRIAVVPSRWQEPFGLVAIEAIACGCVPVGSSQGGLADAIGPCGLTFPNEDSAKLTEALAGLLEKPEEVERFRSQFDSHLHKHQPETVAGNYLKFFGEVLEDPTLLKEVSHG